MASIKGGARREECEGGRAPSRWSEDAVRGGVTREEIGLPVERLVARWGAPVLEQLVEDGSRVSDETGDR